MTPLKNTMFAVSERAGRTKRRLCTISLFLILISCTDNSQQDSNPSGYIEMAQDTTYKVEIDPSTITLEYLDSITNWHELTNISRSLTRKEKNYVLSLKDQKINDRLEFFEDRFYYALGGEEEFGTNDSYVVFYDPVDDLYYRGVREITNGFEFELNQNTNNIDISTRDVLVHVTNLSPSNRLYINIDTGDQLFMTLTQVYDRFYIPEALSENFSDYKLVRYIETDTNNSFYGESNVFIYQNSRGQQYPDPNNEKYIQDPYQLESDVYLRDGFDGTAISFRDFMMHF